MNYHDGKVEYCIIPRYCPGLHDLNSRPLGATYYILKHSKQWYKSYGMGKTDRHNNNISPIVSTSVQLLDNPIGVEIKKCTR